MRGARHRQPTTDGAALPWELLALRILPLLPLEDRIQLATVSKAWAAAVRLNVRGVAIQLGRRSRDLPRRFLRGQTDGGRLALVFPNPASTLSAAAAAAQAGRWDPHEQRLWCEAGRGRPPRPAAAAWHLRRAASAVAGGTQAGARPRSLALLLVGPELDTSAAEVHSMLVAAGAEALFASVCVPLGLLRLDGALGQALNWCNARVAGLASCLQVRPCLPLFTRFSCSGTLPGAALAFDAALEAWAARCPVCAGALTPRPRAPPAPAGSHLLLPPGASGAAAGPFRRPAACLGGHPARRAARAELPGTGGGARGGYGC